MHKTNFIFGVITLLLLSNAVYGAGLSSDGKNIRSAGLKFLASNQNPDGSYGKGENIVLKTSLVIYTMASSDRKYYYNHGPFSSKAVDYLLSQQKPDGSFGDYIDTLNAFEAITLAKPPASALPALKKAKIWLSAQKTAKKPDNVFFGFVLPDGKFFYLQDDINAAFTEKSQSKAQEIISIILNKQDRTDQAPEKFGGIKINANGLFADSVVATALYVTAGDRFAVNAKSFK